jgi:hypothetical protein
MQINIYGEGVEVTGAVRSYIEDKALFSRRCHEVTSSSLARQHPAPPGHPEYLFLNLPHRVSR